MLSYECHNKHLLSATFDTVEGPITIFQIYAPDSSFSEDVVEEFYDMLQRKINAIPENQTYIVMGDFNAKVGSDQQQVWPEAVGRYELGEANDSRAYHSAEIGSDHFPVLAHLQLKLKKAYTSKSSAKTIRRGKTHGKERPSKRFRGEVRGSVRSAAGTGPRRCGNHV